MKQDNKYDSLNQLDALQRVEAPPFLLTRIRQRIADAALPQVSPKWVWATVLSFILIAVLNVYTVSNYSSSQTGTQQPANLVEQMNLQTNNSLYY